MTPLRARESGKRGRPITPYDQTGQGAGAAGVALLFRHGARPDAAAVRALGERTGGFSVTHDPSAAETDDSEPGNWVELVVNGLTFDLIGLAGGPVAPAPAARHSFGLEGAAPGALQALALVPGPHLAGGEAMMPIVRSQLALAVRLAELPGAVVIAWAPAQSWMAVTYFASTVSAWLEGGAFPALGLTAFVAAPDGGLQSEGLAFFTGQELRIEPELAEDPLRATRLGVRLINQLVEHGPVGERHAFAGPEGEALVLEPSANRAFVRVRPER